MCQKEDPLGIKRQNDLTCSTILPCISIHARDHVHKSEHGSVPAQASPVFRHIAHDLTHCNLQQTDAISFSHNRELSDPQHGISELFYFYAHVTSGLNRTESAHSTD